MTNQINDSPVRLNKHLALLLGISRREADDMIANHRVAINQQPAQLGARIKEKDLILVDSKPIATSMKLLYLVLHKPIGYVCSRRQQGETPTVYQLLPEKYHHLKLVGRLDSNSSGLILLTNDGDFAYQMTHPKFIKTKIYQVRLDHKLTPLHRQMISQFGVILTDGHSQFTINRLTDGDDLNWEIIMHQGRNRQIRRTFQALGYTVTKLHRTNFGNYTLNDLSSGQYHLTEKNK